MPTGDAAKARAAANVRTAEQLLQGRVFGPTGVLESDGEHVRCHICGEWFLNLGPHLFQAHGTRAREYKIAFGLMQSTPLLSPALIEARRKHALERMFGEIGKQALAEWEDAGGQAVSRQVPMSEQEQPIREKAKQKIKVSIRRRNVVTGRRVLTVCAQCGRSVELQKNQFKLTVYCSRRCAAKAYGLGTHGHQDGRKHSEETKRRMSEDRKGPEITSVCRNCGMTFTKPVYRTSVCCSRSCLNEYQRNRHSHGTIQRYRSGRCRCSECKAANTAYHRVSRSGGLRADR